MNDKRIGDEFDGGEALSEEEKAHIGDVRGALVFPVAYRDIDQFKKIVTERIVKKFGKGRTLIAISFLRDAQDGRQGIFASTFKASIMGKAHKEFLEFLENPYGIELDTGLVQSVFKRDKPSDPSNE